MKKFVYFLVVLIFIVAVIAIAGYYYGKNLLEQNVEYDTPLIVNIPANTSISEAVNIINRKGYLKPSWFFKYAAKYYAKIENKVIFVGYYKFPTGITKYEMVQALFDPENLYRESVTFPEGISYEKFADILKENLYLDHREFIRLARSDSLLDARNIHAKDIQGYLLPDTYTFFVKTSAKKVLDKLLNYQDKVWQQKYKAKADSLNMTRHEILTLASIIEAETTVPSELKIVSGLYHNRLEKNWLLQADPTVQYAVGEKKRLLRSDLKKEHPYNTYINPGLPPGPINCPGRAAIEAALDPADHNYMFMVAVGDGTGKHNFARTHSQHLIYVREFRRNYRNED